MKIYIRTRQPRFQADALAQNLAIVDRVEAIARTHNTIPGQIALAWVLAQGEQVIPIPGTKHKEYLDENIGAASISLSPDDLRQLDELPPAIGGRY